MAASAASPGSDASGAFFCALCPRSCGAHRTPNSGNGRCRMPSSPRLARAALHFGEEPCIGGQHGSGAIFFSGCSLTCAFCQNRPISHNDFGRTISIPALADVMRASLDMEAVYRILRGEQ